jgi:hypothetical protein
MKNIKEALTIAYGLIGMIVFFAILFYGGNTIISFIGLYYKYLFFVGLPLIAVFWVISKLKK